MSAVDATARTRPTGVSPTAWAAACESFRRPGEDVGRAGERLARYRAATIERFARPPTWLGESTLGAGL